MRSKAGRVAGVLRYPISATAAEKPLPSKGQESFPSWTSPVRPRSPALAKALTRQGFFFRAPGAPDSNCDFSIAEASRRRAPYISVEKYGIGESALRK